MTTREDKSQAPLALRSKDIVYRVQFNCELYSRQELLLSASVPGTIRLDAEDVSRDNKAES